jgi:hypothetical protein
MLSFDSAGSLKQEFKRLSPLLAISENSRRIAATISVISV